MILENIRYVIFCKQIFTVGCTDTASWQNGYGHDCSSYGKRWCENGAAKPGQDWTLGATFKYPENNCCVCGKDDSNTETQSSLMGISIGILFQNNYRRSLYL